MKVIDFCKNEDQGVKMRPPHHVLYRFEMVFLSNVQTVPGKFEENTNTPFTPTKHV